MTFEIQKENFSERRWLTILSNDKIVVSVIARKYSGVWTIHIMAGGRTICEPRSVPEARAKSVYDGIVGKIQRNGL